MPEPRIAKTQRWLDLVAYLAGRRFPVSASELLELPAYAAMTGATARRVFERDRAELRAAGIPLETVRCSPGGNEPGDGYLLRAGDFYLPYLKLVKAGKSPGARAGVREPGTVELLAEDAADALEALSRAAQIPGSPVAAEARRAYAKLALDLEPATFPGAPVHFAEPPGTAEAAGLVRALTTAVLEQRRAHFRYHGIRRGEATERDVRPYGLVRTSGHWYLVGHDETRGAVREFRVGRISGLEVSAGGRGQFDVPEDFALERHLGREAWELGDDPPLRAEVAFTFPLSLWAERGCRGELVRPLAGGGQLRSFEVRQTGPFLRWLLSLGPGAIPASPPQLRAEAESLARETLARLEAPGA